MKGTLKVWVQPGASRDRVAGLHGDAVKVCVSAPPEKGRANKAVAAVLAGCFGVRKSAVRVISGVASRNKIVELDGVDPSRIASAFEGWGREI